MLYKIIGGFTAYHLMLQAIYSRLGTLTETRLEALHLDWVFYLFQPVYYVVSGPVSMLLMAITLILLIRFLRKHQRKQTVYCTAALLLHAQYLLFYFRLLALQ